MFNCQRYDISNVQWLPVGVVLQCRHTCMESRGIRTAGVVTTTSAMLGAMRNEPSARAEFLARVPGRK